MIWIGAAPSWQSAQMGGKDDDEVAASSSLISLQREQQPPELERSMVVGRPLHRGGKSGLGVA